MGRTKHNAASEPPRLCKAGVLQKRRKRKTSTTLIPNMCSPAFKAAATAPRLNLTKRFICFASDEELKELPEAASLQEAIANLLQDVPRRHRRTWRKMLIRAFPELEGHALDKCMVKLVVRCWRLRATAKPYSLHDFIEFCAGQGNLTLACLQNMLHLLVLPR